MTLSKPKIAYLRSLHNRSARHENKRFLVEGKKSILEVLDSDFRIVEGFFVENFINPLKCDFPAEIISPLELAKISSLTSNRDGVVVVEMCDNFSSKISKHNFTLVLDGINDP